MTAVEELSQLSRLFPNALELAITPELRNRYLNEMVHSERFIQGNILRWNFPIVTLPNGVIVQQTAIPFKGATLTVVHKEMRRASSGFPVSYVRQARTSPLSPRQAHKSPHLR